VQEDGAQRPPTETPGGWGTSGEGDSLSIGGGKRAPEDEHASREASKEEVAFVGGGDHKTEDGARGLGSSLPSRKRTVPTGDIFSALCLAPLARKGTLHFASIAILYPAGLSLGKCLQ